MSLEYQPTDTDYIFLGSQTSIQDISNLSMCASIYLEGFGDNNFGRISQQRWIFFVDNSGTPTQGLSVIKYRTGVDTIMRSANNTIQTGQWYHVGAALSATDPALYINGAEPSYYQYDIGDGSYESESGYSQAIGNNISGTRDFDGRLADFRMYDRILDPGEFAAIAHLGGSDNIMDGLIGQWRQDELAPGTGVSTNTVYDISTNRNDGTSWSQSQTYREGILKYRRAI